MEQLVALLIPESSFCFTGESSRYSRKELVQIVEMYGGISADSVTAKLHHLMICDVRNPAWAFEMYGKGGEGHEYAKERQRARSGFRGGFV